MKLSAASTLSRILCVSASDDEQTLIVEAADPACVRPAQKHGGAPRFTDRRPGRRTGCAGHRDGTCSRELRELAERAYAPFAFVCRGVVGERSGTLPRIPTTPARMTLDDLRQALGAERISFIGHSVGSVRSRRASTREPPALRPAHCPPPPPDAGDPHVRFGGRGSSYLYRD